MTPVDLNIVTERIEPGGDQFDLVIATNILLYYDVLEQIAGGRPTSRACCGPAAFC